MPWAAEREHVDPQGRSALVTGGAGGLGEATVRRLVETGCGVAIFDRDGDRARALADDIGEQAIAVAGDVNDDGDVDVAIKAAVSLGPLSVLDRSACARADPCASFALSP